MLLLSFKVDIHRAETFIGPLVTIISASVVSWVLNIVLKRYIRKSSHVLKADPTNYSFIRHAVSALIFVGAVLFIFWNIPELHSISKTLFAGAGILAAIIGFAAQEAVSNIISGIFMVVYKPFRVGDTIKLLSNNQSGVVEDITLRHTIIKGADNRRLVVPNSVISREQILNANLQDERIQLFLEVYLTYKSDHNKALGIMKEEMLKHPLLIDGRTIKQKMESAELVNTKITGLEDKGVHIRASGWAKNDDDAFTMKCELLKTIKERFDKEGIAFAHDEETS